MKEISKYSKTYAIVEKILESKYHDRCPPSSRHDSKEEIQKKREKQKESFVKEAYNLYWTYKLFIPIMILFHLLYLYINIFHFSFYNFSFTTAFIVIINNIPMVLKIRTRDSLSLLENCHFQKKYPKANHGMHYLECIYQEYWDDTITSIMIDNRYIRKYVDKIIKFNRKFLYIDMDSSYDSVYEFKTKIYYFFSLALLFIVSSIFNAELTGSFVLKLLIIGGYVLVVFAGSAEYTNQKFEDLKTNKKIEKFIDWFSEEKYLDIIQNSKILSFIFIVIEKILDQKKIIELVLRVIVYFLLLVLLKNSPYVAGFVYLTILLSVKPSNEEPPFKGSLSYSIKSHFRYYWFPYIIAGHIVYNSILGSIHLFGYSQKIPKFLPAIYNNNQDYIQYMSAISITIALIYLIRYLMSSYEKYFSKKFVVKDDAAKTILKLFKETKND